MKKLTAALLVFLMMVMTGAMALAYTEGTYTATAQGNNGPVTVSVTFSADAITDVTVVEHSETAGLSDRPIAEIPAAIVENQSLAVDTVSGATNSSNAILTAVADCVAQAGGDVEALKAVAVEKAPVEDVEATYDVVVLGGGGAGLTASITAAQNGAKVILITHYDDAPGTALADVVLLCGAKENPLDSGSMPVKLAVLFVANVLVLRYTLDNQELTAQSLSRTSRALGSKLM